MSEPDSPQDIVSEGAEAYAERGFEGLTETWHPDVVYEEDPMFPGAATYRGRVTVLARLREYEEQLGPSKVVIDRIDVGPDGVVLIYRTSGQTPGAGVPFAHTWGWLVQMRDGRPGYIRAYFDPGEALRAAGLADQ